MRDKHFLFRLNSEERCILAALARRLERSQSDTVRWLIRNAAAELAAQSETTPPTPATPGPARPVETAASDAQPA